ncbi:MAG: DUF3857 domain-containing protein [Pseudomarimonas sp.]
MWRVIPQSRFGRLLLLLSILLASLAPIAGAGEGYDIEPAPAWVLTIKPDLESPTPEAQVSNGRHYLLADYQTRLADAGAEQHMHFAVRALDQAGVDDIANLQIAFDPSYQKLALHQLDVIRDGQRKSRLDTAQFRLLQREEDLEYRLLDGSETLSIVIDDVRIGDVLEYAFARRGSNPVFEGRQFGSISLQWSLPIGHLHARLLHAASRKLQVRVANSDQTGTQRQTGGWIERRWNLHEVAPQLIEGDAPGWYDPYPRVEWSEFADWPAVVAWAKPLFTPPAVAGREVKALASEIAAAHKMPPERLQAALRRVQSDIRYLGLEMGAGSHRPSPPATVLARRFGDCKDKTLLLLTLLREMDIDAQAALVNTYRRDALAKIQPSPGLFNHVIVRARIGDKTYWLDPTRAEQEAPLDSLYQPEFGLALVVADDVDDLVDMHIHSPRLEREVHAELDSRDGYDKPARFTLTTTHSGGLAEGAWQRIAAANKEQLQQDYLNYYSKFFPSVRATAPIEFKFDVERNRLVTKEHYEVDDWWSHSAAEKRLNAAITPPDIHDQLLAPETLVRHAPLSIEHPRVVTMTTRVHLPEEFSIDDESWEVSDPHFTFTRNKTSLPSGFQLIDRFVSSSDHVAIDAVASYAAKLQEARSRLEISLWRKDDVPAAGWIEGTNWLIVMLSIMALAIFSWMASKLYRWDPSTPLPPPVPGLIGIRGWLFLPLLGVLINPFVMAYSVYQMQPAFTLETWNSVTVPGGESYHPLWAPVMVFELVGNLGLLVLSGLIFIVFLQRRRNLPMLYSGFMIIHTSVLLIDQLALTRLPGFSAAELNQGWSEIGKGAVSAIIWVSYFSVSQRVKSTFTRRWGEKPAVAPPASPQPAVLDPEANPAPILPAADAVAPQQA